MNKLLALLLSVLSVAVMVGCQAAPKAVVTVTGVVDAAMEAYADAQVSGRTTPKIDAEVKAAHDLYRVESARALVIYQAAVGAGNATNRLEALRIAVDAANVLLDELFPVLPSASLDGKQELTKAIAP